MKKALKACSHGGKLSQRRRRNDLELKTALIQRLIDCNDHESAYEFTLEIMKKLGDNTPISPELCTQITRLQAEDNSKLLKLVENVQNVPMKANVVVSIVH